MYVKRDPAPWGKLSDSLVPTGWTRVSAARHVVHFHRMEGMLQEQGKTGRFRDTGTDGTFSVLSGYHNRALGDDFRTLTLACETAIRTI
jgi:hypothetical protein